MARKIDTTQAGEITSKNIETKEVFKGTLSDTVSTKIDGNDWDARQAETTSTTHLEDDTGYGVPIIIRTFEFSVNPEAFRLHKPTKQELFNAHAKQIEMFLWKDGLKVVPETDPKVTINGKKTKYRIFVGATPAQGHRLFQTPKTLTEIVHGTSNV